MPLLEAADLSQLSYNILFHRVKSGLACGSRGVVWVHVLGKHVLLPSMTHDLPTVTIVTVFGSNKVITVAISVFSFCCYKAANACQSSNSCQLGVYIPNFITHLPNLCDYLFWRRQIKQHLDSLHFLSQTTETCRKLYGPWTLPVARCIVVFHLLFELFYHRLQLIHLIPQTTSYGILHHPSSFGIWDCIHDHRTNLRSIHELQRIAQQISPILTTE